MKILKEYRIVIAVVLPVMILVILRSAGTNHFKPDAPRWAEPSVTGANLVSYEKFMSLDGEKLIIMANDTSVPAGAAKILNIPMASVLEDQNIKAIRDHHGPVLLVTSETASEAKAWMILSEMGIKNLYILGTGDMGKLKYKFTPDSSGVGVEE